jgi:hypothetical protein
MDRTDEVITDVRLNGDSVPVPLFLDPQWDWPAHGEFSCQFIHFPTHEAISSLRYESLLEEARVDLLSLRCLSSLTLLCGFVQLKNQANDMDRVVLLEIIAKGSGDVTPSFSWCVPFKLEVTMS